MSKNKKVKIGGARADAASFSDLLARDSRETPKILADESFTYRGVEDTDAAIYTSRDFLELEYQKLWPKIWQMACREQDIANVGDTYLYEIGDSSILITRSDETTIKAFYNSCLHRGRKLRTKSGKTPHFRCPFHGFTWALDGAFKGAPCQWDFPQLEGRDMHLPEMKVDTWAGFIFINMDPESESLDDYLGEVVEHYKRWKLEDCAKILHVRKRIDCNWKVASEAFMEAMHVEATHPQALSYTADVNTRYDTYGDHVNRALTPFGEQSPLLSENLSEQNILDSLLSNTGPLADLGLEPIKLEKGQTARAVLAEMSRMAFSHEDGGDYSQITDSELLDAYTYNIFPNFSPWGGFMPNIVYRWMPDGHEVDSCYMEVMILKRVAKGEAMPKSAPLIKLTDEQNWAEVKELGTLAEIFQQDMGNMPYVQQGLKASKSGRVLLSNYQESRIRHFHQTLHKYVSA